MQPIGQTFTYPPPLPPSYGILPPNSYPTPFLPSQPYGTLSRVPYQPELSDGEDDDTIKTQVMCPPFTQPASTVAACKVAGSRHPNAVPSQAKGKRKAVTTAELPTKKRSGRGGHASGIPNYNDDDVAALLDACMNCLPLGAKGWLAVEEEFAAWADSHDHPTRPARSLELKFKQLVHTTKLTGDAECPPHIERAHEINFHMNEKAGTQDLNDDEFADEVVNIGSDEEPQQARTPKVSIKTEIREPALSSCHSVSTPTPRPHSSHTSGLDLLTSIMASLDPRLQAARDDEHTAWTLQTTQLVSTSNQLQDVHMTINSLRDQLLQCERERANAEHCADCLEMQLEMAQLVWKGPDRQLMSQTPQTPQPRYIRREMKYTDGGASTIWVSPDDEDEGSNFNHDNLGDVVSQQDYIKDPKTGCHTLRRPSTSPIRQTPSSSAQFNVSFTPTSSRTGMNDLSVIISPTQHIPPTLSHSMTQSVLPAHAED
ncbi:hypothetical protein BDR04DRAFT_1163624 [Suillus decipiens]|nr:hypothetical protein BDR04DRAFT_1163624 [Suillus decipiens]